ncbi:hypothetical protein F4777DRAFT_355236 [Nemania sp. FL0916]|nr:hypothetical protein F4777DRAFT_355236 [Nemania sp. FL0916]
MIMAFHLGNADQYPVYVGIWTNWSRGQLFGLTLTLTDRIASGVIAGTATFVTIVGSYFWKAVCFSLHRLYAKSTPQNAIYHQRQAILRNSSTAEEGLEQLARLIWVNRGRRGRLAPLPALVAGLIFMYSFLVASTLLPIISTTVGTDVLIRSLNCGFLSLNGVRETDTDGKFHDNLKNSALAVLKAENIDNAANYARQCYSNNTDDSAYCARFATEKLISSIDRHAACPFEEKMCRSSSMNLRIDSGYIESREHLGLNSRDIFLAKIVLHCAPIVTTGFASQQSTSIGNLTLYHYGELLTLSGWQNYVFAAKSIESQYAFNLSPITPNIDGNYGIFPIGYTVENQTVVRSSIGFVPISSLFRHDADVTLVFLTGNGVIHSGPSADEWYRVSPTPQNVSQLTGVIYLPQEPASPLGCINQYQFCRDDARNCGPLASLADARSGAARLFNPRTSHERANSSADDPFNYFIAGFSEFQSATMRELIQQLGSASLASKISLTAGLQGSLPSNQWQLDVMHWSDIMKASLQAAYLGISYFDPLNRSLIEYRTNFTSKALRTMCDNQIKRSAKYTSFSVFALLLIYIIGWLIVLVSLSLESISKILHKKWGLGTFAHLEWNTNAILQLQRLAHEPIGFGTWSKGAVEVPVTEAGDLLGCLDISNPDHPVLKHCTSAEGIHPVKASRLQVARH